MSLSHRSAGFDRQDRCVLSVHTAAWHTNNENPNRRTRECYVSAPCFAPGARTTERRTLRDGVRALRRRSYGGLLLLAPASADGGGARGGHQGPEDLATELLLLASRRAVPRADQETEGHRGEGDRDQEEVVDRGKGTDERASQRAEVNAGPAMRRSKADCPVVVEGTSRVPEQRWSAPNGPAQLQQRRRGPRFAARRRSGPALCRRSRRSPPHDAQGGLRHDRAGISPRSRSSPTSSPRSSDLPATVGEGKGCAVAQGA